MESNPAEPGPVQEEAYPPPYNPPVPVNSYPDPQVYGYPSVQIYPNLQPQSYPLQDYPAINVPLIYPGQPVDNPVRSRRRVRRPARRQQRVLTPGVKLLACAQIFLSFLIVVLSVFALHLNHWVKYCSIHIGLQDTYYDGDTISFNKQEDTFCSLPFDGLSDCGDICSHMKSFKSSGIQMIGLGTPAMLATGLCFIRMVVLLVRRIRLCRELILRFVLVAVMVLWVTGTVLYISTYWDVQSDTETDVEEGFSLAIVVAMLQVVHCVLGNVAVSKLV